MPEPVPLTMAVYPWDLARAGVVAAVDEIAAVGVQAIEVASNYHTIDAVSPRAGVRSYSSARGSVLFPARRERYGRIVPMTAEPDVRGAWPVAADRARARGLTLHAAVVPLFQPWIVDAHPDCARVLPTGDPVSTSVCPSDPDVREYLAALCADLVDQFGVELLRFQGTMPAAYDFDWLRPRTAVKVPPVARELLACCFCRTCTARGRSLGLDVDGLRRRVRATIGEALESGVGVAPDDVLDDELRAYLVQYERAANELLSAVRAGVGTPGSVRISSTAWTPFPRLLAGSLDEVVAGLVTAVDHVSLTPGWFSERNRRLRPVAAQASSPIDLGMVLMKLSGGAEDGERPVELDEAVSLAVDDVTVFTWGSLRKRDVDELVAAVRAVWGDRRLDSTH
jgi:hypothetical protein